MKRYSSSSIHSSLPCTSWLAPQVPDPNALLQKSGTYATKKMNLIYLIRTKGQFALHISFLLLFFL